MSPAAMLLRRIQLEAYKAEADAPEKDRHMSLEEAWQLYSPRLAALEAEDPERAARELVEWNTDAAGVKATIPTEYEDPGWYFVMHKLVRKISASSERRGRKLPELPTFGSIPHQIHAVNARTYRVPGTSQHLVVFDRQVFILVHLFARVTAQCFPAELNGRTFSADRSRMQSQIDGDPDIRARFYDLIASRLLLGRPSEADRYEVARLHDRIGGSLTSSIESFIFGHELGHVLLQHLSQDRRLRTESPNRSYKDVAVSYSWEREFEADQAGLTLAAQAVRDGGEDWAFALTGGDALFTCLHAIDRAGSFIGRRRSDSAAPTHPPPWARRDRLRSQLARSVPNDKLTEKDVSSALAFATAIQFAAHHLVEGLKPALGYTGAQLLTLLSRRSDAGGSRKFTDMDFVQAVLVLRDQVKRDLRNGRWS